jgi:hypothetical protein
VSRLDSLIKSAIQNQENSKYSYYVETFVVLAKFDIQRFQDASVRNALFYASQNLWIYTNQVISLICPNNPNCSALQTASTYVLAYFFHLTTETAVRDLHQTLAIIRDGITESASAKQTSIISGLRFLKVLIKLKLGSLAGVAGKLSFCMYQLSVTNHIKPQHRLPLEEICRFLIKVQTDLKANSTNYSDHSTVNVALLSQMTRDTLKKCPAPFMRKK